MKPKRMSILISFVAAAVSCSCGLAACPSPDLTGDCFVDFSDFALLAIDWPATDYNDFALMAEQWLTPDPSVPDDMAYVPAGTFQMGDSFDEGSSDELPVHTVTVDSFYMGRYEVTNRQYCDYLNSALAKGLITVTSGRVNQAGSGTIHQYCDAHSFYSESQIDYSGGGFSVRSKSGRSMVDDPMLAVSWYVDQQCKLLPRSAPELRRSDGSLQRRRISFSPGLRITLCTLVFYTLHPSEVRIAI